MTDGWDVLTTAEQRVVALVAQGRSNPEAAAALDVSRRTVDNHLYRIFRKLRVSNRVALVLRVAAWEPLRPPAAVPGVGLTEKQ